MKTVTLNGSWSMHPMIDAESAYMEAFQLKEAYPAQIPGSVLSCLLENKAIADPYYRNNEYQIRELFWQDYSFRRKFTVSEKLLEEEIIELVCYGLDTLADIYVNQALAASTSNMHRTYRISLKEYLRAGENEIEIIFRSTLRYIENYKPEENKKIYFDASGAMSGNQYLRKAHSMFGWDWGAQLPDAGIFRDIQLEAYSQARISEIKYTQEHEHELVSVKVMPVILKTQKGACGEYSCEVTLTGPKGEMLKASGTQEITFAVQQPKLWWPNGLGKQPLYTVKTVLKQGETVLDKREDKIGLRTFTVSREKDRWGEEFAFMVNGVKFFAMGADYIPEDCIYSRITRERLAYLVKSAVKANYNCLRVWGGGYYPSDDFFDLCDRYGLVVWQDLMYACNVYDMTEEFEENIVAETLDNVRRIRHHASLGLWCGNNEIESGWHHWDDFQKQTPYLRADYIKQFEYVLPKALKQADDQTFFWPSSPSSGGCLDDPDDENRGDTHYWAVWHGQKPFSDYQKYFFRFCSEFGFQSFPSYKTVYSYTEKEDRNIFSQVMESHQKNDAANGKMLYYISENFRYPKDFESLLYTTQILQAAAIKSGVEHWRRNRGRCMGTLYWQMNDNWPVASWASIDYYGRWKALHYMARNFYMPVAGSLVRIPDEDSSIANGGEQFSAAAVHLANESFLPVKATVTLSLKTFDFEVIASTTREVVVPAFESVKVLEEDFSQYVQRQPRISTTPARKRTGKVYAKKDVFLEAVFVYQDGRIQIESETLIPYKHIDMPCADIRAVVTEEKKAYKIELTADKYAAFVELDFADADVIFSDNYFNLTNHNSKKIYLEKEDIRNGSFQDAQEVQRRLQIRSIKDSYES